MGQAPGEDVLEILDQEDLEQVQGRGWTARWVFVGDEGVGQAAFAFSVGDCAYTVWLAPGTSAQQAPAYIARY